jgi:predicted metalloendopeptidase
LSDADYTAFLVSNVSAWISDCASAPTDAAACAPLAALKLSLKADIWYNHLPALPQPLSTSVRPLVNVFAYRAAYCMQQLQADFNNVFQHEEFVNGVNPGTTAAVQSLVQELYDELGRTIIATSWLDQATRTRAMNKWQLMTRNVAYDSTWYNPRYGLVVTGDYALDITAGNSYYMQRQMSAWDLPADVLTPELTGSTAFTVNAYYVPFLNSINMLPGMMFFPVFDASLPPMLNMASYGWIVGHEMTHGFDSNGRLFDGLGDEVNWWSDASVAQFDERAQCLVDQYSDIRILGQAVNGSTTLGENIADNGGLGLAYRAFAAQSNVTQLLSGTSISNEQLFWVRHTATA